MYFYLLKKQNYFFFKSFFSTNHKDIGILYFWFALGAGFLGLMLSVLMRIELTTLKNNVIHSSYELYISIAIVHALIMLFFFIKNNTRYRGI